MKRILSLWLAALIMAVQPAQAVVMVGFGQSAGGYVADYDFEETGAPTGFSTNIGSPNYDYTTDPLKDSQSLFLGGKTNAADTRVDLTYTAVSSISQKARFKLKDSGGGASGTDTFFQVLNGATALTIISFVYVSSTTYYLRVQSYGGTAVNTSATISVGTEYLICWTYTLGTGANATSSIAAVAWTGTEECPTSGTLYAESTDGTRTNQATITRFGGEYTSATDAFDLIIDGVVE